MNHFDAYITHDEGKRELVASLEADTWLEAARLSAGGGQPVTIYLLYLHPKSDEVALRKRNVCKFHILLTTFEVATKEIRALSRVQWKVLFIDEAPKLKNPESKIVFFLL